MPLKTIALTTCLGLAVAAMGCRDTDQNALTPSTPVPANASTITISIVAGAMNLGDAAFGENPLVIEQGKTVTWVNDDAVPHTSTAIAGAWDSGPLVPGQSFSYKFNDTGSFTYLCRFHPRMHGTVLVVAAGH